VPKAKLFDSLKNLEAVFANMSRRRYTVGQMASFLAKHIESGKFSKLSDILKAINDDKGDLLKTEILTSHSELCDLAPQQVVVALLHMAHHHNTRNPTYQDHTAILGEKQVQLYSTETDVLIKIH
jgi:hypothetical protein